MNDPLLRFSDKYIPEPNSGCWLWQAAVSGCGYGIFWINNKNTLAHRSSYEMFIGDVPQGIFVCHSCDNRLCVNPEHLFLGTPADNSRDCNVKGRRPRGEDFVRSVINPDVVRQIRTSDLPDTEWATRLGVSKGAVNHIRHHRNWRHVL